MTHWARIYEALRPLVDNAHFHAGHNFIGCRQAGAGVVAQFEGGAEAAGELLIAADGLRSTMRPRLLPETLNARELQPPSRVSRELQKTARLPGGASVLSRAVAIVHSSIGFCDQRPYFASS